MVSPQRSYEDFQGLSPEPIWDPTQAEEALAEALEHQYPVTLLTEVNGRLYPPEHDDLLF